MKWPWISAVDHARALTAEHERFAQRLEHFQDVHQQKLEQANQRYDALLDKYHALKLAGAVEAPKALPPKPYDPVMQAINEACSGKPITVRKAMLQQLALDRSSGIDDEEIIQRIVAGQSSNGVPA